MAEDTLTGITAPQIRIPDSEIESTTQSIPVGPVKAVKPRDRRQFAVRWLIGGQ
jgi:hypothetical protein